MFPNSHPDNFGTNGAVMFREKARTCSTKSVKKFGKRNPLKIGILRFVLLMMGGEQGKRKSILH